MECVLPLVLSGAFASSGVALPVTLGMFLHG